MVKSLPTVWETRIQSLGLEDLLEKEMATPSSTLVWKSPWLEGAWRATVRGVAKSRRRLSDFAFTLKTLLAISSDLPWTVFSPDETCYSCLFLKDTKLQSSECCLQKFMFVF